MTMPPMPESDKVLAAAPVSQRIGEFLDWLKDRGLVLGKHTAVLDPPVRYTPVVCPSCLKGDNCWRLKDECSLSVSGLGRYHYDGQEEAQEAAADLEDERRIEAEENPVFLPLHYSTERLLAEFFEIDLDKVEQERRALLDAMRGPA